MFLKKLRARTAERPQSLEGEFLARYTFALQYTKDKEVLDIGTGLGAGAHHIALKGAKRVLGIDYSKSAIMLAEQNFSLPNLEFQIMDALNISLSADSFDVVTAFEIIEHLLPTCHQQFLIKITKLLRPGGALLISTPNKLASSEEKRPYNPYHTKEFEPPEFLDILQEHFAEVLLRGVRCVNKDYLKKQRELERRSISRIASFLGKYKIVRQILGYIPKNLKQKVTSERQLPSLKASDFKISSNHIENSESLLAVCK